MLGYFAGADENYWDVVGVAGAEGFVAVDIYFAQLCVEIAQGWGHRDFGFFAEVAIGAGVERYVAGSGHGEAAVFGALVKIAAFAWFQQAFAN